MQDFIEKLNNEGKLMSVFVEMNDKIIISFNDTFNTLEEMEGGIEIFFENDNSLYIPYNYDGLEVDIVGTTTEYSYCYDNGMGIIVTFLN